jgi:hypothetical protein
MASNAFVGFILIILFLELFTLLMGAFTEPSSIPPRLSRWVTQGTADGYDVWSWRKFDILAESGRTNFLLRYLLHKIFIHSFCITNFN